MRRSIRILLVVALALSTTVAIPRADAKKNAKPVITFSTCPFAANQKGRTYRLTTGPAACNDDGITVSANNVTIDLGGFKLTGDGTAFKAGVRISPNVVGTKIKHGTITGFTRGIEAPTSATGTIVDRISAIETGAFGMLLGPATVRRSIVAKNGTGIDIKGTGTGRGFIQNSLATNNSSDGFAMSQLSTGLIDRSSSIANSNRGVFMAADTGIVRRSTISGNLGIGVNMLGATKNVADRVQASSNGAQGIVMDATAKSPLVTKSKAVDNGKAGFDQGIVVFTPDNATVISSTALGNFGDGINVVSATAKVNGNTANGNGWGVVDGANYGINAPNGNGRNHAAGNDADSNQCVDDVLC